MLRTMTRASSPAEEIGGSREGDDSLLRLALIGAPFQLRQRGEVVPLPRTAERVVA